VAIHPNEVVVDIGVKQSGYIPADELSSDATKLPSEIVKTGDEIECIVTKKDDSEGIVYLSKKRADAALGFRKAVKAFEDNATITGTIIASIKGGFIVLSEGVRVFVPGSQSGLPRNAKPEDILKKQVRMKVIEINENRNRVVGSVRATFREGNPEAKAKIWDNIAVGQKFKGEVKSIQKYGAFVDLGGVDGMVHITELSWGKIRHPSDVISVGDKLEVYVKSFDKEKEKIALGAKDPDSDPWNRFMKDYQLGDVLRVKIVNVTPFGAFAEIIPGVDGLIHISQLSTERVDKVNDYAKIGQEVVVKITFIDEETKRISLSIRAVLEEDAAAATSEAESNGGSQNDSGEKPDSSDELKETENAKAE
jgi:4-hydroxy-3-methylbut-2-enyl diphosphate reductase